MNRMIRLSLCLVLSVCAALANAGPAPCDNPNPLRFSLIPRTDVAKQLEEHRPMLRRLEAVLGRKIVVIQPASYGTVIEGLLAGTVDLASMGPASYLLAKQRDPSITPFVTWTMKGGTFVKPGVHFYNALLVTRNDSGISDIAGLKGKSITLADPASTSGAVIPRQEFGELIGQRLEEYFAHVTYSGSHDRSLDALKKGYTDAAFVASPAFDEAIRQGRVDVRTWRVLWQSRPIPRDPFVYRGKLCSDLRAKIRQAFLTDTPEVRSMLSNLKAERFVTVSDDDYKGLRETIERSRY